MTIDKDEDARVMAAAIALSMRGAGRTGRNPNVACIILNDGRVVGRGWTQPGGRPHAEAMALSQAAEHARGGTAYVTLEPCAHVSARGPRCAEGLAAAGLARVVIAAGDPDPRTDGRGIGMLRGAGIAVTADVLATEARSAMAGYFMRAGAGRPHVTLKLALSLDGRIALADGTSRWITGPAARRHVHVGRAMADGIVVGRGTLDADDPALDVRLAGLEDRAPQRILLSGRSAGVPDGWLHLAAPSQIATLPLDGNSLIVEGGAGAAAAFLRAGCVDRLMIYRAPILIGTGRPALSDIGLADLPSAHGRWRLAGSGRFGPDGVEVYEAVRGQ